MKVLKKSKDETFEDIYTDNYEFRLCGGSVEPSDSKERADDADETGDVNAVAAEEA